MAKMGRPTKYKPEYCDRLVEHMAQGLSFESFAGVVLVARSSLYEWESQFPDFSDAKKIGESASLLWWERILHDHADGSCQFGKTGALVYAMCNRFKELYSNKHMEQAEPPKPVIIHTVKNDKKVELTSVKGKK